MMTCQACGVEIIGRDRFCRNCGAPPAHSIGDLVDTYRLDPNDQAVRNNSELAQALEPLQPSAEVAVKVYRDGEIINSRIKVADRTFPPLLPKMEPRDQGYLGIKDSGRRCCISGTKKWGVEIYQTTDNTSAGIFGLRSGDLITEFDGHAIRTPHELNRRIRAAKPRSKFQVEGLSNGS